MSKMIYNMSMEYESREIIDFVMFVIYRLSESWGKPASSVYDILNSCGALSKYIIPFYDVLHTLGAEYLVEDITAYVKNHGGCV